MAKSPEERLRELLACLDVDEPARVREMVPGVIEHLDDPEPGIRQAALDVLGRLVTFKGVRVDGAVVDRAIALTRDASESVRAEAAAALALLAEEEDVPARRRALHSLLDDPSARVRQEATAALGDLNDASAREMIAALFDDPDPGVRFEAAFALATLKDPRARPLLERALKKTNLRLDACEALRRLGDPNAAQALHRLARRPFLAWVDALTIAATLHALGEADAGANILARTRSRRREERAYALALIGSHRIEAGLDILKEVAGDHRDPLRDTAVRALGELGDPRAADILRAISRDTDAPDELRADARTSLERLPGDRV